MSPAGPKRAKPQRSYTPRFTKPLASYCDDCVLSTRGGPGFVPDSGPPAAPVLLMGEAPWVDEVIFGTGFSGTSGSMLERVLRLIGRSKEQARLSNMIQCIAPEMAIEKFPGAVAACRYKDDMLRDRPPQVLVTLGTVPLRHTLALPAKKNHTIENFHGTVARDPTDRYWITHTYHPSYLQRGAVNLMSVMAFDLGRAFEVAEHGWEKDPGVLVVDPPLDWFAAWVDQYLAAVAHDGPWAYPLAVDIETPDKGADEGVILASGADHSYQINRVNLSCNPDEGVTVPYVQGYIEILDRLFAGAGVQGYWFKGYDYPRLAHAGHAMKPDLALDGMWMWKVLQSDLPMGLGFAAPFYSRWGAWKHLAETQPGQYGAIDGLQTRRVVDGLMRDLIAQGQWHVFADHMHRFHRTALAPATEVGVAIDRERLAAFKVTLDEKATRLLDEIQTAIPDSLRPLTGGLKNQGLTQPPASTLHDKARTHTVKGVLKAEPPDPVKAALFARAVVVERLVLREILLCKTCGKTEVLATHRCQPGLPVGKEKLPDARPILAKEVVSVRRWFWQEPFNPDSPQQLMAYVTAKGYTPGTSKQTGNPSVDRETLSRLLRESGDPFFQHLIDYKAVTKIRGTYVVGTEKRLDDEDRVHPTTGFKPSTMRTSQTNPNYQNIVADKGGKESIAAGFRSCVVARGRWVEEGSEYADETR